MKTITIAMGEANLALHQYGNGASPTRLVRVHGDELAARANGVRWAEDFNDGFIDVDNPTRDIIFQLAGETVRFDPNRIFTDEGIRHELAEQGSFCNQTIVESIALFRQTLLSLLAGADTIIALHNNIEFPIDGYCDGGDFQSSAEAVYVAADMHRQDFAIVTQRQDYERLQLAGISVVLLIATQSDHGGSLSEYCLQHGIRYINIETRQGHQQQQWEILQACCHSV